MIWPLLVAATQLDVCGEVSSSHATSFVRPFGPELKEINDWIRDGDGEHGGMGYGVWGMGYGGSFGAEKKD